MTWIDYIVKSNGIYDLLCGFVLLSGGQDGFHATLYKNGLTPIDHEFLGLYVLANGCVRVSGHRRLIAASYLVEALWALQNGYELRWHVADAWLVGSLSLMCFCYVEE